MTLLPEIHDQIRDAAGRRAHGSAPARPTPRRWRRVIGPIGVAASLAVVAGVLAVVLLNGDRANVGTSAAGAPVRFSVSISDDRLVYEHGSAILSVTMRTGSSPVETSMVLNQSTWPALHVTGSPTTIGKPRLSGPGRITGAVVSSGVGTAQVGPSCSRGRPANEGNGVEVSLPPHSVSTLHYPVRLDAPPWPGLKPTIIAYATLPTNKTVRLPTIHLSTAGRTAVRVALVKRGPGPNYLGYPVVARNQPVRITGVTDPRIPNAQLRITADAFANPKDDQGLRRTLVATVVTSPAGTFALTWRPSARGDYRITTSPIHATPSHYAGYSCNLTLVVR